MPSDDEFDYVPKGMLKPKKATPDGASENDWPPACVYPEPLPRHPEGLCCRQGKMNVARGEPRCEIHWNWERP